MRRISSVALLFFLFASCAYYRPVMVEGGGRRGAASVPCREVSRSRCNTDQCRGANMDLVTYQCAGTQSMTRCVANFRCSAD
jgi:hypothetical protein